MAKWHGQIGYVVTDEVKPGVWKEQVTWKDHRGDVLKNTRQWQSSDSANDNLNVNNQISIVANAFAYENFHQMRYIEFMGALWKISNAEVQRPRIILSIGGLYNGQQT